VPVVLAPDNPAQRYDLCVDQAASDDPPADRDQDQHMAALELLRYLEVNDEAVWRIKHRVMQAMATREAPRQLSGFVQVDDA